MNYDRIAPYYDLLGAIYTAGGIRRAKLGHLDMVGPDQHIAYVGAGSGEECKEAAERGANVTVIERSHAMLTSCRRRFEGTDLGATFLELDVRALQTGATSFDLVVAPFFFNVFSKAELPAIMAHLTGLVRDGGHLISVDFRAPSSRPALSVLQRLYYIPPLLLFWCCTRNPWHELYNYEREARRADLPLTLQSRRRHTAYGLPLLETLVWTKT